MSLQDITGKNGHAPAHAKWVLRRVNTAMQISFDGWLWSVLPLSAAQVGDLVQVTSDGSGGVQCRLFESAQQTSTLALPVGPARNLLHTCQPPCNATNSGSVTTCCVTAPECPCPDARAADTPQLLPCATLRAHMHSRNDGTAHAAPGAGATPTLQGGLHQCSAEQPHRMTGTDNEWVPLTSSVSFKADEVALCQCMKFQCEKFLETTAEEGFQ